MCHYKIYFSNISGVEKGTLVGQPRYNLIVDKRENKINDLESVNEYEKK